jgi:hypothetical protein
LQAALNTALPGDTIELAAGATFTGHFVLPKKSGSGWVWIRSSAYASLPPRGTRVSPSNAGLMPKIVSPDYAATITFDTGASFYRLSGLEVTTTFSTTSAENYGLIVMGASAAGVAATSASQLPTDVVFDRCYIHGTPTGNIRRGITMNSARTAVIDSYISNIHEINTDTQAIGGWNGTGPFAIVNNYIEAAGENVMFGGADPSISNLVPSDIEIRENLFSKPLSWKSGDPSYAGMPWTVKNLLELKNAQRLLIDGNVFERIWPAGQAGFAIMLTPRNQSGTAPWSTVQDVTISNNVFRYSANGINMLGQDDPVSGGGVSLRQTRVRINNNLFHHIDSILFQILGGVNNVTIQHNTGLQGGSIVLADGSPADQGFVFTDNLAPHNAFGIFGSNVGVGNAAIAFYMPGAVLTNNVIAGPWPTSGGATTAMYSNYPSTFFPASLDAVGFVDRANDNYILSSSSPYKGKASDGKDIGVDFNALNAAQSGSTASGSPSLPPPTPVPTAPPSSGSSSDTTPPSVTITAPTSGATLAPGTQTVTVNASDNVGVTLVKTAVNGQVFCGKTAPPFTCAVTLSGSLATIDVWAYDAAGNSRMAEVNVKVAAGGSTSSPSPSGPDTTPPSVTITAPTSGATLAPGTQTVTVNASDNVGVTMVKTAVNNQVFCQKTAPPFTCPVTLSGSLATIDVWAYDAAGNSRMAEVNVRVAAGGSTSGSSTPDTTPPSVTITSPTSGATLGKGAQTVTANASDNVGVTLVKTAVNGAVICQKTAAPYSCPVSLSGSLATIDVWAYDAAGNSRMAEVNVHVSP